MINTLELKKLKESAPLPLVIGVIMFFAPMFLIQPRYENLATIESTLESTMKSAQESLNQKRADLEFARRKSFLEGEVGRMDRWLVPQSFMPNLIDRFNALAEICSVKLKSITYKFPKEIPDSAPVKENIVFQLEAEYGGMRVFLQALEFFPLPLLPVEVTAIDSRLFTIEMLYLVKP